MEPIKIRKFLSEDEGNGSSVVLNAKVPSYKTHVDGSVKYVPDIRLKITSTAAPGGVAVLKTKEEFLALREVLDNALSEMDGIVEKTEELNKTFNL